MKKVLEVPHADIDGLTSQCLQVTGLEVELAPSCRALNVILAYSCHPPAPDRTIDLVLSPPAAAQLSRLLSQALENYLYDGESEETG